MNQQRKQTMDGGFVFFWGAWWELMSDYLFFEIWLLHGQEQLLILGLRPLRRQQKRRRGLPGAHRKLQHDALRRTIPGPSIWQLQALDRRWGHGRLSVSACEEKVVNLAEFLYLWFAPLSIHSDQFSPTFYTVPTSMQKVGMLTRMILKN